MYSLSPSTCSISRGLSLRTGSGGSSGSSLKWIGSGGISAFKKLR